MQPFAAPPTSPISRMRALAEEVNQEMEHEEFRRLQREHEGDIGWDLYSLRQIERDSRDDITNQEHWWRMNITRLLIEAEGTEMMIQQRYLQQKAKLVKEIDTLTDMSNTKMQEAQELRRALPNVQEVHYHIQHQTKIIATQEDALNIQLEEGKAQSKLVRIMQKNEIPELQKRVAKLDAANMKHCFTKKKVQRENRRLNNEVQLLKEGKDVVDGKLREMILQDIVNQAERTRHDTAHQMEAEWASLMSDHSEFRYQELEGIQGGAGDGEHVLMIGMIVFLAVMAWLVRKIQIN